MALGARLRFEILRRDDYTCRYCGATAPDVRLTVDHVVPRALGGTDTPDNLAASCSDCNAGKASLGPSESVVEQVSAKNLEWAQALEVASANLQARSAERPEEVDLVENAWLGWHSTDSKGDQHPVPRPMAWRSSVIVFLDRGLQAETMVELVAVAMGKEHIGLDDVWRYFCGCCWRRIEELEEEALRVIAEGNRSPETESP